MADLGQLEQALVDVSRVALDGDLESVRLLCRRLVRRVPTDSSHPRQLKEAMLDILDRAPAADESALRGGSASAIVDDTGASWIRYPANVPHPILAPEVARTVRMLIAEHAEPAVLEQFDLTPSKAVLFTGPPGVGKTLTAEYVASALQLPLLTVNLASLISSLMGRTGQNLQSVLAVAAEQPCVVFFDEFDALAKSREDSSDIGEVRRLVNVILQQLDRWPAGSLLLAATNHSQMLDPAVHRRFDMTIRFELPTLEERVRVLAESAALARVSLPKVDVEILARVTDGWSHSDIQSWVRRSLRRAVLDDSRADINVAAALLGGAQEAARDAVAGKPEVRRQVADFASRHAKWSNRQIADWLGVTHPTIGSDLRQVRAKKSNEQI